MNQYREIRRLFMMHVRSAVLDRRPGQRRPDRASADRLREAFWEEDVDDMPGVTAPGDDERSTH